VLVLNTRNVAKFRFVTFDITRKNYLYWILNVEIHLDAMGLGDTIRERNKAFEQLICSCENNIVNRDFTNNMNLLQAFVWLNKAMKLFMKNHEIHPICSIPKSEWSNKYYEVISCLCVTEQSTKLSMENHETCPISLIPLLEVNATTFDLYFHDCDIDYGHGYKENFKDTFCHLK